MGVGRGRSGQEDRSVKEGERGRRRDTVERARPAEREELVGEKNRGSRKEGGDGPVGG